MKKYNVYSLIIWIASLIAISFIIGMLTNAEVNTWYTTLQRSPLTPPNYVFPVVWSILYAIIGACGWRIWQASYSNTLHTIKYLYVIQLILNWSWSPFFFLYQATGLSLLVVALMDCVTLALMWRTYHTMRAVSILMIPYLLWITFATYLNFYIWWYN